MLINVTSAKELSFFLTKKYTGDITIVGKGYTVNFFFHKDNVFCLESYVDRKMTRSQRYEHMMKEVAYYLKKGCAVTAFVKIY